ncbi:unnamed protein product [Schistosoma margrebowiei]|uniref:Uncharacterized protein n=1 Tax=Schistosoma margrebowiei TaxID=48269 RepID=A0A183MEF7_9TREM|nr:unnamed protein product [Schistosoma margrebowiei]
MVVGGSRPETLDPGFVLLGTCHVFLGLPPFCFPSKFQVISSQCQFDDVLNMLSYPFPLSFLNFLFN